MIKYECNGICLTAGDIGLGDVASGVAYPHPDCDVHGRPADLRNKVFHILDSYGVYEEFVPSIDALVYDLIYAVEEEHGRQ